MEENVCPGEGIKPYTTLKSRLCYCQRHCWIPPTSQLYPFDWVHKKITKRAIYVTFYRSFILTRSRLIRYYCCNVKLVNWSSQRKTYWKRNFDSLPPWQVRRRLPVLPWELPLHCRVGQTSWCPCVAWSETHACVDDTSSTLRTDQMPCSENRPIKKQPITQVGYKSLWKITHTWP